MGEVLLRAMRLSKYFKYGNKDLKAVDDISLEVERGSALGLVVESGSRKSTVARLILNLIPPTAGKVEFLGQSLFDLPPSKVRKVRREMHIVFQNPYLPFFPQMSVGANITEPFAINKKELKYMTKNDRMDKIFQLMDLMGIPREYYGAYPHEMSGRQQQRVGMARALALNPKLIICDEPVSNLDVLIQAQILNLL